MEATAKETAADTLVLLEERLQRINYILTGATTSHTTDDTAEPTTPATTRLRHLERSLASLAIRSPAVSEILALQKSHPSIFNSSSTQPNDLSPNQLTQLILSHTPLYTTLSSQLSQLASNPSIPDNKPFTQAIQLQDRIRKARDKEAELQKEVAELRQRSAKVVQKWYEKGVLEMGGQWAEWEERCREMEIVVRREEARRGREEGVV